MGEDAPVESTEASRIQLICGHSCEEMGEEVLRGDELPVTERVCKTQMCASILDGI